MTAAFAGNAEKESLLAILALLAPNAHPQNNPGQGHHATGSAWPNGSRPDVGYGVLHTE